MHSALPARLLVDDTHAYILMYCEGNNPVSALGVGGKVGLTAQISEVYSPHLEVAICGFVMLGNLKKREKKTRYISTLLHYCNTDMQLSSLKTHWIHQVFVQ